MLRSWRQPIERRNAATFRLLTWAFVALALSMPFAAAQDTLGFPASSIDAATVKDGRITGLIWRQPGSGPHPAIVMLHGCGGLYGRNREPTARHRDWAERFHALGFVVLHVDSFGPRDLGPICEIDQRKISPGRERARDAYAALAHLQSRREVRPDAIVLLGWSNGGSTTLHAIGVDSAARPATLEHDFAAAVAFYPGCRTLATRRRGWTSAIPLLLLIGDADDWTPLQPCQSLIDRAVSYGAPASLVAYAGAYHDFDAPNTRLRVRTRIATTPSGTATVGTDPAARDDAIRRVPAFVADRLRGR